MEMNMNI